MDFALKFTIIFFILFYLIFFVLRFCFILNIKKRILQLAENEKEVSPNIFFVINNVLNHKHKNHFFHFDYSY